MTPLQIRLVRESFESLEPDLEEFAQSIYLHLFERRPNIRYLFSGDESDQARMLGAMLSTIIAGLERGEALWPALRSLGLRHTHYGVRAEDYRQFGIALDVTLEQFLGERYDGGLREAWAAFYSFVARVMKGHWDTSPVRPTPELGKFGGPF